MPRVTRATRFVWRESPPQGRRATRMARSLWTAQCHQPRAVEYGLPPQNNSTRLCSQKRRMREALQAASKARCQPNSAPTLSVRNGSDSSDGNAAMAHIVCREWASHRSGGSVRRRYAHRRRTRYENAGDLLSGQRSKHVRIQNIDQMQRQQTKRRTPGDTGTVAHVMARRRRSAQRADTEDIAEAALPRGATAPHQHARQSPPSSGKSIDVMLDSEERRAS